MIEIRTPAEADREQVASVMRVSLNFPAAFVAQRAKVLPLDTFRCAFDGDRVVATAAVREFRQWFGGREIEMAGIWGVATLPEYRGTGLATRCVTQILHEAREAGTPITALFPATDRPYRRLGYEHAGNYVRHAVRLDDLPGEAGPLAVEPYRPERDLEAVRECYREAASNANGPIDSDEPFWWQERILGHWNADEVHHVVIAQSEGGSVEGYASFVQQHDEGLLDVSFSLSCKHFVWSTDDGLRSLLGYLRGFRGIGQRLLFTGPPNPLFDLLVDEQRMSVDWQVRWMLRLLDVPGAIEARGYPPVSGEATIAVHDEVFADNRGPFLIEADAGKVRVTRGEASAALRPIDVRTLSAMFTGYLSAHDAARLGLIDADDPAVPFLAELFAGPAPWMYDFF